MGKKIVANNKKAFHDFLILEKYNAGMVLTGTEIKSIRQGAINLKDSFAKIEDGEVWLYNVPHIFCRVKPQNFYKNAGTHKN